MTSDALPSRSRAALVVLAAAALTVGMAGGANAATKPAVRSADVPAPGVLAADAFSRSVTGGLGTADAGGAWYTPAAAGSYSVAAGAARVALLAKGTGADALLKGVQSTDTDLTAGLSLDRRQTGSGTYVSVVGRQSAGSSYRLKLHYYANRTVSATLVSSTAAGEPALSAPMTLAGYTQGTVLRVRFDVAGTSPTTLSAKVWPATAAEPTGWQLRATDSTAALQVPGSVGISTFLSGTATNAPMTVALSDLRATGAVATITDGPAAGSHSQDTSAAFSFTSSRDGSSFSCQLDGGAWTTCAAPASYGSLAVGDHTFSVRGVDADGNLSSADSRTWTVDAPPAPPAPTAPVEPGPDNTGVPAGTVLTQHDGDITLDQPGETLDATDVHGFVWIKAPNVHITRSIIRGGYGVPGKGVGLVTDYGYPNFVIEDSELTPEHPSVAFDSIKGWDYTARRLNMHGTVDGAKIHGDDVLVESSWIHDMVDYPSDPYQNGGPTHNDGAQILGGDNIIIRGNNISGASNSAIQVTQDLRAVTNLQILGNWFDGGHQNVALNAKPLPSLANIIIADNRFGRHTTYSNCAVLTWGDVTITASNNVWDDNGSPIRIHPG